MNMCVNTRVSVCEDVRRYIDIYIYLLCLWWKQVYESMKMCVDLDTSVSVSEDVRRYT